MKAVPLQQFSRGHAPYDELEEEHERSEDAPFLGRQARGRSNRDEGSELRHRVTDVRVGVLASVCCLMRTS